LALAQGLLEPVDAAAQFIELPLLGEAQVLEQLVAIALQLAAGLLFKAWGFSAQGTQHVLHEYGGVAGVELAATHPFLAHVAEPFGHQGTGAQAAEQQLLQGVIGVHRGAGSREALLLQAWRFLRCLAMGDRPNLRSWLSPLLGGTLVGWASSPPAWGALQTAAVPLLWLGLALLWRLQDRPGARWRSAVWGALAVIVSHRWLLALHPLDWIGVPLPLSLPICWVLLLLCGGLAALLVSIWSSLVLRLGARHLGTALLMAGLWGAVEVSLARSPLFWFGLGAAALPGDPPLAGLAALGGAGLVAALQLLIGWGLWRLLDRSTVLGPRGARLPAWGGAALLLVGLHGLGALQLQPGITTSGTTKETVLLVQPAVPTREKQQWQARRRLERQLRDALVEAEAVGADLVLLPEGALGLEPVLAEPAAVELISGGFRWQAAAGARLEEQRSALLRFAPGERGFSSGLDKHRLVPLGEWVPFSGLVRWSGLSAVGGVAPGAPSRLLARPAGPVAAAICYEIADGAALRQAVRQGGGWLLASANLDPYPALLQRQFTALARLRAIESGRWLVSVANTGPSQLIDAQGRVRQSLASGVTATGLVTVPVLQGLSPYGRSGEALLLGLMLVGLLLRAAGPRGST
jgi:apolipoprotein N-acyltransferase